MTIKSLCEYAPYGAAINYRGQSFMLLSIDLVNFKATISHPARGMHTVPVWALKWELFKPSDFLVSNNSPEGLRQGHFAVNIPKSHWVSKRDY